MGPISKLSYFHFSSTKMANSLAVCLAFLMTLSAMDCRVVTENTYIEWTIPFTPYELCVAPGSAVIFNYEAYHNVVLVGSLLEWQQCDGISNTEPNTGPFIWDAPSTDGTFYVVCGAYNHCDLGQKVIITVSNDC